MIMNCLNILFSGEIGGYGYFWQFEQLVSIVTIKNLEILFSDTL